MSVNCLRSKKWGQVIKVRVPVWSRTARLDVAIEHAYISVRNVASADRLALEIRRKVDSIAALGLTGVSRSDYGSGIRSIACRERLIFFRVVDDELIVLRVLHGHQDISAEDFEQEED
ncbi:type II toxin-antitoxin system RelE/ParE family toxin [uncultured Agrobacterium sp.]|uniref:type II toxin-antitoxin system RelE/ParE family toxin n=1 Tax=uncultured Agrobacterium sp. TaxID=157277 RepID=UPI00338FAC59